MQDRSLATIRWRFERQTGQKFWLVPAGEVFDLANGKLVCSVGDVHVVRVCEPHFETDVDPETGHADCVLVDSPNNYRLINLS